MGSLINAYNRLAGAALFESGLASEIWFYRKR